MPAKKEDSPTSANDVNVRDFYKDTLPRYRVSCFDVPRGRAGNGMGHASLPVKSITWVNGRILIH